MSAKLHTNKLTSFCMKPLNCMFINYEHFKYPQKCIKAAASYDGCFFFISAHLGNTY